MSKEGYIIVTRLKTMVLTSTGVNLHEFVQSCEYNNVTHMNNRSNLLPLCNYIAICDKMETKI